MAIVIKPIYEARLCTVHQRPLVYTLFPWLLHEHLDIANATLEEREVVPC